MHLAEGTLPLAQAALWTAVAVPVVVWGLRGELSRGRQLDESRTLFAGAPSLLFAATLLPLPVPVIGATSHICLTPLLGLLLGVRRVAAATFLVLILQAIFFAHGGLTTLGVNTLSLGVVGPLAAIAIARLTHAFGLNYLFSVAIACFIGDLAVYVTDALVLALALSDSVAPLTTFRTVVAAFAPVQVPLAVLEGAIGLALIRMLAMHRPAYLPAWMRASLPVPTAVPLFLLLPLIGLLAGCGYAPIDDSVFSATAATGGQPPRPGLIDLSDGEVGLAGSIVVLFSCGFIAGRSWERLRAPRHVDES